MPIIPYFSKKNCMLGNFSTAFSLKILKGRLLKMFMSQCNSDTKALEIHPERYHCQREADMCSKHVCARLCHDANALGCRRAAASQTKLAVMFVNGCVAFFSNYFLQEPTEADLNKFSERPSSLFTRLSDAHGRVGKHRFDTRRVSNTGLTKNDLKSRFLNVQCLLLNSLNTEMFFVSLTFF